MDCYVSKLDPSIPSPQKMKLDLEQVMIKMIMMMIMITIKSMTMTMTLPSMKVHFRKKNEIIYTLPLEPFAFRFLKTTISVIIEFLFS